MGFSSGEEWKTSKATTFAGNQAKKSQGKCKHLSGRILYNIAFCWTAFKEVFLLRFWFLG